MILTVASLWEEKKIISTPTIEYNSLPLTWVVYTIFPLVFGDKMKTGLFEEFVSEH